MCLTSLVWHLEFVLQLVLASQMHSKHSLDMRLSLFAVVEFVEPKLVVVVVGGGNCCAFDGD